MTGQDTATLIGAHFGFTQAALLGRRKSQSLMFARACLYWALRQRGLTLWKIGKLMGRDRTSISRVVRDIDLHIGATPGLRETLLSVAQLMPCDEQRTFCRSSSPHRSPASKASDYMCVRRDCGISWHMRRRTAKKNPGNQETKKVPRLNSLQWHEWATRLSAALLIESRTTGDVLSWISTELKLSGEVARHLLAFGDGESWFLAADGKWRAGVRRKAEAAE